MRKVLFFCISVFMVLLIAPIATFYIINSDNGTANQTAETTDIFFKTTANTEITTTNTELPVEINEDAEYIVSRAISICDQSFSDEALKAVLSIVRNNYIYAQSNNIEKESINITKYSDEFYERLKTLYSNLDTDMTYEKHCVYIPASFLSDGNTKSGDYKYIRAVASPWDCTHKEYVYAKEYSEGVSLAGIDYLCKEGMDYKTALKWYLPDFDIK